MVCVFLICRHSLAYVCWRFLLLQGHRRSANCFRGVHFLFRATCGVFRSLSPSICFLLFQDHFCPQKKSWTRWNHFASFQSWRLTVKHKGCEKPKEDTGRNSHPKMYLLKTWNMFGQATWTALPNFKKASASRTPLFGVILGVLVGNSWGGNLTN